MKMMLARRGMARGALLVKIKDNSALAENPCSSDQQNKRVAKTIETN